MLAKSKTNSSTSQQQKFRKNSNGPGPKEGINHRSKWSQVFAPGIAASATEGEEIKPTCGLNHPDVFLAGLGWFLWGSLTTFGEFINHGEPFRWMFQSME
jgi:hypothetical protein